MKINFKRPEAEDAVKIAPFFYARPNKTCDSGMLDTYIWLDYYHIELALLDEKAVLMKMEANNEVFSSLPYCREEDLPYYFGLLKDYFNEELQKPLKIYLADEEGVSLLGLKENPDWIVREEEDLKDYIYDAEALRHLTGNKLQKKRNLVNRFEREYDGRWYYRSLCCGDKEQVEVFLHKWYEGRKKELGDASEELASEERGLKDILRDCDKLPYKKGGIFLDNELVAFSLGAYNPTEEMAIVSVEKAFSEISGIYQLLNREFLLHEFPEARLVNREDDMGMEGLRKAKLSYHPVAYARKYMLLQKDREGYQEELYDYYENEIAGYGRGKRDERD